MLETSFERIRGDIGHPETFAFAVLHRTVPGATARRVVERSDALLLAPFIEAARALVDQGATAITTSCGFLIDFQEALQAALPVPVWTSSLLLIPELSAALPEGRRIGVITVDAGALTEQRLQAAGVDPATPVEGLAPGCDFQRCLLDDEARLFDRASAERATVEAALRLVAREPSVASIVFECTNLPPYADAVRRATGRPVYDITTLVHDRFSIA